MGTDSIGFTEGDGTFIATHKISEDGVEKELERIAPGAGVFDSFNWTSDKFDITAVGLDTNSIPTAGKGRIVITPRALSANVTALTTLAIRVFFYATDGTLIGPSGIITPEFAEYIEGSTYIYGTPVVFANDVGAASCKIYLVSFPGSATSVSFIGKGL